MKRRYGGVEIDLPGLVDVFDLEARRPIFHHERREQTACGIDRYTPTNDGVSFLVPTTIPTKHARRFARPCRRCWPALARDGQLELELEEAPL